MIQPFRIHHSYCFVVSTLAVSLVISASTAAADEAMDIDPPDEKCATFLADDDRDDPEAITFQGVNCFQAEKYDWALTYYTTAYSMASDPFLLGGIGRSLHELGLYEPAEDYYRRFLDGGGAASGADRIRARLEELETARDETAAPVSLRTSPSGITAYVVLDNGHWYELGTTPLEVELRSGEYEFAFYAPGYRPRLVTKSLDGKAPKRVHTELVSEESALNISDRRRRSAGVWTMATSVPVTAAGGTLLALYAQDDDRQSLQTPGTIVSAAGLTALITGAVLYFSASSDDPEPTPPPEQLSLQPTLGVNHLGFRLQF